jgi:hypothetical protein
LFRAAAGQVDHRLARRQTIRRYKDGLVSREDICDAHRELMRVARNIGTTTDETCPICEDAALVHVVYAFGPRLPPCGKLVETPADQARLDRGTTEVSCYRVECCPSCGWNHLLTTWKVGRPQTKRAASR